ERKKITTPNGKRVIAYYPKMDRDPAQRVADLNAEAGKRQAKIDSEAKSDRRMKISLNQRKAQLDQSVKRSLTVEVDKDKQTARAREASPAGQRRERAGPGRPARSIPSLAANLQAAASTGLLGIRPTPDHGFVVWLPATPDHPAHVAADGTWSVGSQQGSGWFALAQAIGLPFHDALRCVDADTPSGTAAPPPADDLLAGGPQ